MNISEFDFYLPAGYIATKPVYPRDSAKMLVLDKDKKTFRNSYFFDLPKFLKSGDILVLNDSKVIPARLYGLSGGRRFEVLLVTNIKDSLWKCWVKPGRKAQIGTEFIFSNNLKATLIKRNDEIFTFEFNLIGQKFYKEIYKIGEIPIPPYIKKERKGESSFVDKADYQTIYAKNEGSVAAPTAGLHFTKDLIEKLKKSGVGVEKVTLHVGLGTFQPVNTEKIRDFKIHSEYCELSDATAKRLNKAKDEGKRIIAVGTTSLRVLESVATDGKLKGFSGETQIYIYPGHRFKYVDGMITNFHLPKSSLLLLVSALAGKEYVLDSYNYAIENGYRFYSYGDGMLIL